MKAEGGNKAGNWLARLEDLRKRLVIMIVCVFISSIVCFYYINEIRVLLLKPAGNPELIYISPAEALMANIRLAFAAGVVLVSPLLIYQIIALVWPFLTRERKKLMIFLPLFMIFLFVAGLIFSYMVVYPMAIQFFKSFEDETLEAVFTLHNYLSFSISFMFAFGLAFQLPLVFLFLGALELVRPEFLRKNRKYALLVMLIVSAIITPPDVFSQILMTVPLMILYELGIFMVVLVQRRKQKKTEDVDNLLDV
ncbi:MAG: twin-arginine translocase subunit TatC [Firmicutes bacterium]|nr:twin-arginine translocase subunit TatC [Bacillota bacterium]